jgi:hypothetical protein
MKDELRHPQPQGRGQLNTTFSTIFPRERAVFAAEGQKGFCKSQSERFT